MSSFTPHRSQNIRWDVIADHFLLAFPNPHRDSLDFFIRHTSRQPQRQRDLASLAYELASCIAERGDRIRATFPKPNASAETWREAGVVDGDLFPQAFLDRLEGLNGPNPLTEPNARCLKVTWYRALSPEADRAATALVINALAEYPDSGRYLPSLAYLAQQPRVLLTDMGFHYNLPPSVPETFVKRDAIISYVNITIANYLLLNMLLIVDPNFYSGSPLLRDTSFPNPATMWELPLTRSNIDNTDREEYADFKEPLHHSFWTAFSDEDGVDAGFISVYMDRCLSFLAGWYAIMTESTVKARALKYYFPTDFVVKDLATVILLRLRDISLTFDPPSFDTENPVGFMEKWMSELPPPIDLEPPVVPALSKTPNEVQGTSTFMLLPRELRHHIFSFLPLPLVVPLASLCRELHETCTDLIYARPISALQIHRINALDINASDPLRARGLRLEKFLATRPDLCTRLRSFNLSAFDAMVTGANVKRRDAQISLFHPVVTSMRGLSKIKLFLPYPSCGLCESDPGTYPVQCGQVFYSVLRVMIGQWPHLHSLTIGHFPKSLTRHPNHDFTLDIDPSLRVEAVPDVDLRWDLRTLTIQRPRTIDWGTGLEETPAKHVPLRLLINTSLHSLRYLSISSSSDELADVESFPICPAVTNLALNSELTGETVTRLLARCFPAVTFLKVSYNDTELWWNPEDAVNVSFIDYPRCVPQLEELSYYMYSLKALPSSTKTVILNHEWESVETEIRTFENVEAVYLSGPFKEDEHIQRLSLSFPNISSLEVPVTPYRERDMMQLANSLATHLPHLKQFVIEISDFTRAGRRLDYPVDDGMEPVQQECAVMFFRTCPALEILSFNGIPDDWEYECRFQSRVWVKTVDSDGVVGARMAGRSALRWKVSEDGNHRGGPYF